jgi:hypothetical protein
MPELNPYARFLDGRPIPDILAATPATLEGLAASIGPAHIAQPPAPGKWTPAEILCHLADCEIAFSFRLRQTLAQENHIMQPFDQDDWARLYPRITAQQALAAFAAMPEAAGKKVTHPERGTMTFSTILETMAGHDINHITQLKKLVQSA